MIEKVKKDPVSAKMLKINGDDLMKELKIEPGKRLGSILAILLEDVLEDPKRNTKKYLFGRAEKLQQDSDQELAKKAASSKERAAAAQEKIDAEIKEKYFVK